MKKLRCMSSATRAMSEKELLMQSMAFMTFGVHDLD